MSFGDGVVGERWEGSGWRCGGINTYKMFWSSFEDVDLFACICFSACLPEYLFSYQLSVIYATKKPTIAFHSVSDH